LPPGLPAVPQYFNRTPIGSAKQTILFVQLDNKLISQVIDTLRSLNLGKVDDIH
jgi:hypothetical protein